MVCAEIRKQFGVPLESLGYVRSFMLQKGADHFGTAVQLMDRLGVGVYLLTDLKKEFIMDSELEFTDLMTHGYFRPDRQQAYIFMSVNHLVNRLLACLKEPIHLELHGRGYEIMHLIRETTTASNQQEVQVLNLIRQRAHKRVVMHLKDGEVIRADLEGQMSGEELQSREKKILEALEMGDYETVTVTMRGGKVAHVARRNPIRFDTSRHRRPSPRPGAPGGTRAEG